MGSSKWAWSGTSKRIVSPGWPPAGRRTLSVVWPWSVWTKTMPVGVDSLGIWVRNCIYSSVVDGNNKRSCNARMGKRKWSSCTNNEDHGHHTNGNIMPLVNRDHIQDWQLPFIHVYDPQPLRSHSKWSISVLSSFSFSTCLARRPWLLQRRQKSSKWQCTRI